MKKNNLSKKNFFLLKNPKKWPFSFKNGNFSLNQAYFNDLKANGELIKVGSGVSDNLILFAKGVGHFGPTMPPIFRGFLLKLFKK